MPASVSLLVPSPSAHCGPRGGDRVVATAWAWELHVPGSPGKEEQPSGTLQTWTEIATVLSHGDCPCCTFPKESWTQQRFWPGASSGPGLGAVPHWCSRGEQPSPALEGVEGLPLDNFWAGCISLWIVHGRCLWLCNCWITVTTLSLAHGAAGHCTHPLPQSAPVPQLRWRGKGSLPLPNPRRRVGQSPSRGFGELHCPRNVLALPPAGMVPGRRVVAGDTHWEDIPTPRAPGCQRWALLHLSQGKAEQSCS